MTRSAENVPVGTWILDGHNVIYAVPELADRQREGHKRSARDAVVRRARAFAARRRVRVLVVFDGEGGGGDPETRAGAAVEVLYGSGSGGADDLIASRAEALMGRGARVTVVTGDRPLRARLPGRAETVDPVAFWSAASPRGTLPRQGVGADPGGEKPTLTDPDIAAHFLDLDRDVPSPPPDRPPARSPSRSPARPRRRRRG